ncbi:hypothetical protein BD779DRAFT_1381919, partial [Infundibulicybe gibba]
VHLDSCFSFGGASTPGIFGRLGDAIVDIYRFRGVDDVIKWVDDFVFFRYPSQSGPQSSPSFSYDESLITSVAEDLGWPWAPEKTSPFASSFTYIGFRWDLAARTVSLP